MKKELTYGENLIVARNQNEIRELVSTKKRIIEDIEQSINELIKQNREILER